ncbi:MAG: type II toxin-antitoxin system HicA family toxin [Acidobacteria bacterium]|nr:type II toxin-antitoxin system HicA family toxin [Acidobacteriota bacterium]
MGINYANLRSLTAREVITALLQDGFVLRGGKGSHRRFQHKDGRRVTVSCHALSDTFPPKTLKTILEGQACWTEDDCITPLMFTIQLQPE